MTLPILNGDSILDSCLHGERIYCHPLAGAYFKNLMVQLHWSKNPWILNSGLDIGHFDIQSKSMAWKFSCRACSSDSLHGIPSNDKQQKNYNIQYL